MWSCSFHVTGHDAGSNNGRRRQRKARRLASRALTATGVPTLLAGSIIALAIADYVRPRRDEIAITSIVNANGEPVTGLTREEWVVVRGEVRNRSIGEAILEANGLLSPVTVQNGSFESKVPLIRGPNRIRALLDRRESGVSGDTPTMKLVADIPPVLVWSELTWDGAGDVDLHLTDTAGEDCSYANRGPTRGGALLDFDNTTRDGPEHITVSGQHPGTYRLWVQYFATHGRTSSVHWKVALRLGNTHVVRTFSGVLQNAGDNATATTFALQ